MYAQNALADETARLAALRRLDILDTPPEEPFENVVNLVRAVLGVPISVVTLLDEERQWFKARVGLDATETPRDVSFCTHTIRQRMPLVIPDAKADSRFADNALVNGAPHIRAYAGVPLVTSDGYNVGALCAIDTRPRDFSEGEIAILRNFASIVVNEMELRRIAERDQLTGVLTRRGFLDRVEKEMARARRHGHAASLVLIDIDHFKTVNDTWGHPAGDAVLRELAKVLHGSGRHADLLGRIGGEEFAMLLPEADGAAALAAAERHRAAIAAHPIAIAPARTIAITASFGIAALDDTTATAEDWIARADVPLYEAKHAGRNRCIAA
ncbi:sensor domain-containing diguanylate cyclase [Novosphingobium sp. AP12]|uniref:GGDEF domain-containing protein n=1 Tax=Novosphingobium sp. AP12 TaxID=1144305 RepID=UPI000271EC51|nr:sensor domain-containing diguanylate cyclase [Novosphingobium sp. AP12]EJL31328.1 diguanylate cyclase (GGDEF) domain-containing protein [Novosphingobium sp. AP12]